MWSCYLLLPLCKRSDLIKAVDSGGGGRERERESPTFQCSRQFDFHGHTQTITRDVGKECVKYTTIHSPQKHYCRQHLLQNITDTRLLTWVENSFGIGNHLLYLSLFQTETENWKLTFPAKSVISTASIIIKSSYGLSFIKKVFKRDIYVYLVNTQTHTRIQMSWRLMHMFWIFYVFF